MICFTESVEYALAEYPRVQLTKKDKRRKKSKNSTIFNSDNFPENEKGGLERTCK